LYLIVLFY